MNKEILKIGIPSKGRISLESKKILKNKNLKIYSERGERDLLGKIKNKPNIQILYLHAREIIDQLNFGNLDVGISGYDLLREADINIQKNVGIIKKLNFAHARLVLAVREEWIDCYTTLDLDEIADDFRKKNKKLIKIGTKYPNSTRDFLYSKGVTQFEIVKSLAETAGKRLKEMQYNNVTVKYGDGYEGWQEYAPFDAIIVIAAPDQVPQALIDQLKFGGRLVLPIGVQYQELKVIIKMDDDKITEKYIIPVRFVPMVHFSKSNEDSSHYKIIE